MCAEIARLKQQIVFAPKTSSELFEQIVRQCRKRTTKKGANKLETRRIRTLECIKSATRFAVDKLKNVALKSPFVEDLHPFFRELLEISVNIEDYKSCASRVYSASKLINRIGRGYIIKVKRSQKTDEIVRFEREFFGRTYSILKDIEDCLSTVRNFQVTFQNLPDIDVSLPTVIIAGAPNVGKSSLLRRLSRAKPEVKPYPFTTKELIVGHLEHLLGKIQLIDTPGLLDSPLEEKKNVERKAVIALKHISNLVLFIVDPTETCGFSLDYQKKVLESIRSIVSCDVWIVLNKADIASPLDVENFKKKFNINEFFIISAEKGVNIDKLKNEIIEYFQSKNAKI